MLGNCYSAVLIPCFVVPTATLLYATFCVVYASNRKNWASRRHYDVTAFTSGSTAAVTSSADVAGSTLSERLNCLRLTTASAMPLSHVIALAKPSTSGRYNTVRHTSSYPHRFFSLSRWARNNEKRRETVRPAVSKFCAQVRYKFIYSQQYKRPTDYNVQTAAAVAMPSSDVCNGDACMLLV